jgi:serine/threonine-protein kinase RsbT
MSVIASETLPIASEPDMVTVRRRVREAAARTGLSLVDQTKLVTAASELARNTLIYGGGGTMQLDMLNGPRLGVRLIFVDQGPGIPDVDLALRDGFTTGAGLGLGLSGSKRLVNEFEIDSKVGQGTRVAVTRWK